MDTFPAALVDVELIFTCPDEDRLRRLCLAAVAVAEGAELLRTTRAPWQLRVVRPPAMDDATWRGALIRLIEMH